MSTIKNVRASDKTNFIDYKASGFIPRKRTAIQQIIFVLISSLFITAGVSVLVSNNTLTGPIICFFVGLVMTYIGWKLERLKKDQQATEFMNALFSSAMARGYLFCLVVQQGGDIFYLSRPFQSIFPTFVEQPIHTIDKWFDLYHVSPEHREKVNAVISGNIEGKLSIVTKEENDMPSKSFVLSIEPIDRPTGFMMVRAQAGVPS